MTSRMNVLATLAALAVVLTSMGALRADTSITTAMPADNLNADLRATAALFQVRSAAGTPVATVTGTGLVKGLSFCLKAQSTPPMTSSTPEGALWMKSTDHKVYVWNASAWAALH